MGIDLGGTKTAAGLVYDDGTLSERLAVATAPWRGTGAVVETLVQLVNALAALGREKDVVVCGIGVATTGMVDRALGTLSATTDALPGWSGFPLRDELERATTMKAVVLNDVHAMALAEHQLGAGREAGDVLYVAVGTGIGGALMLAGSLVGGAHGWAGDLGHMVVDVSSAARRCPCGRTGHLEAYASGPALAGEYERRVNIAGLSGDLRSVVNRAREGEVIAMEVLKEGATTLGRGLGGVVNLLDPDLVVFGGGLVDIESGLFWAYVTDAINSEKRSPGIARCERARLGNDAAVVGAALAALFEQ